MNPTRIPPVFPLALYCLNYTGPQPNLPAGAVLCRQQNRNAIGPLSVEEIAEFGQPGFTFVDFEGLGGSDQLYWANPSAARNLAAMFGQAKADKNCLGWYAPPVAGMNWNPTWSGDFPISGAAVEFLKSHGVFEPLDFVLTSFYWTRAPQSTMLTATAVGSVSADSVRQQATADLGFWLRASTDQLHYCQKTGKPVAVCLSPRFSGAGSADSTLLPMDLWDQILLTVRGWSDQGRIICAIFWDRPAAPITPALQVYVDQFALRTG